MANQASLAHWQNALEGLVENFNDFFGLNKTTKQLRQITSDLNMIKLFEPASKTLGSCGPSLVRLPFWFKNVASIHQTTVKTHTIHSCNRGGGMQRRIPNDMRSTRSSQQHHNRGRSYNGQVFDYSGIPLFFSHSHLHGIIIISNRNRCYPQLRSNNNRALNWCF